MKKSVELVFCVRFMSAALIFGVTASLAADPYVADYQVVVYQNANYEGSSAGWGGVQSPVEPGSAWFEVPDLTKVRMPNGTKWNYQISSLIVGYEIVLVVYEDTNFRGKCMAIWGVGLGARTGKMSDLRAQNANLSGSKNWDNRVSSLRLAPYPIACP